MNPETQPPEQRLPTKGEQPCSSLDIALQQPESALSALPEKDAVVHWIYFGPLGLRAGWSVLIWAMLMFSFLVSFSFVLAQLHTFDHKARVTPPNMFLSELVPVLALLASVKVLTLIERRHFLDYNLKGLRSPQHFFTGLAAGFVALSALVCTLAAGGWLHFFGAGLAGTAILWFSAAWAVVFLLVACFEEGTFRCYLQATLTRGINFWWALGSVAFMCALLAARHKGNGAWGDYFLALLGVVPCFILHRKRTEHSAFWQASWVTSTLFGLVHTGNGGENWIGIFAAGAIGFVFCVSVRVTGSAWWAIGAHAGWDWGETFFYGTADSGMVAEGHYLNTTVGGNALWSGGANGPEGSLLVIGAILLLLLLLLAAYRKGLNKGIAEPCGDGSRFATPGR